MQQLSFRGLLGRLEFGLNLQCLAGEYVHTALVTLAARVADLEIVGSRLKPERLELLRWSCVGAVDVDGRFFVGRVKLHLAHVGLVPKSGIEAGMKPGAIPERIVHVIAAPARIKTTAI